jgi:hypothetical protein
MFYSKDLIYLFKKNYELRLVTINLEPRLWRFNNIDAHKDIIDLIYNFTKVNDVILIWGSESGINFITGRGSPSRYVYQYPLFYLNYTTEEKVDEFVKSVKSRKPKLVIDASESTFDNQVDQGRIFSLDLSKREGLVAKSKDPSKYDAFDEFYKYIDVNYQSIGFTYNNKWQVFKLKEKIIQ